MGKAEKPLHLCAQLLARGEQATFHDVADFRELLAGRVLPSNLGEVTPKTSNSDAFLGDLLLLADELPIQNVRLAADFVELFLKAGDQAFELDPSRLERSGLTDLGQDQQ